VTPPAASLVAGLDSAERPAASGAADAWLDWIFSQPGAGHRARSHPLGGRLRAAQRRARAAGAVRPQPGDTQRPAPPPAAPGCHAARGLGPALSLRGQFTQALLKRPGELQHWSGQFFAELPQADLRQLRRHVDLPFQLSEGDGALRAWAEVKDGQPTAATLDLALRAVKLRLLESAPELDLTDIQAAWTWPAPRTA
jgi:hypothetical protein